MKDLNDLSKQAHDDCLQHVNETLTGEFWIEMGKSEVSWNRVLLRNIFHQAMTVWREYDEFDVILDASNEPVGFVDYDKWRDCEWKQMTEIEIKTLVNPENPMDENTMVTEIQKGERDCLEAKLIPVPKASGVGYMKVQINPKRFAIISMVPVLE